MPFPLGKPILVMLIAAALSGIAVALHAPKPGADLTLWTFFPDRGYELDRSIVSKWEQRNGLSVRVQLMLSRALDTRLLSLFMRSDAGVSCPDLVEVEIQSVGKFFRPPVDEIGFLPWDEYLDRTGLRQQFSAARLAVWTKDGHIFGLPQDLHPVSLTYRKDLFDVAGVNPTLARTWPELQAACLEFQRYWRAHGEPGRRAMELSSYSAENLDIMLQQRHISLLDAQNRIFLADPKVAKTVAFYTGLIAGPDSIAGDSNPGATRFVNDVTAGDLCMIFTADWRAGELRQHGSELQGKLAMMPLPRFDPDDAPTASWGGTMMAIPKQSAHPDAARALAIYLTTDSDALKANSLADAYLIPPIPARWADPFYHRPDSFFADHQSVDDLFVRLAGQLPIRYVTPFTAVASIELSGVLGDALAYRRAHGDAGLITHCQQMLNAAAEDLARRIQFGTFTDSSHGN